jgi:hypothetical protein
MAGLTKSPIFAASANQRRSMKAPRVDQIAKPHANRLLSFLPQPANVCVIHCMVSPKTQKKHAFKTHLPYI